MILKSDGKSEEKPIYCFKNDKNLVNFDPSTQKSKTFALSLFLVPFCAKYITFDIEKYRRITFHGIEDFYKI